jgi:phosphatidylinositol alpha-mannosyltransferase
VVLEAMAVGLPVIGYDLPSSREVFGDIMIRVPYGHAEAFAQAILQLLEDDAKRREYAFSGRQLALSRDWNPIAQTFFEQVQA